MSPAFQAAASRQANRPWSPSMSKSDFGDEDKVDLPQGQGGVGGDKAGVAAHELHQADAVGGSQGLGMGRPDGLVAISTAVSKPKERLHQGDVVVNGLGDDDDAFSQLPRAISW